MSKKGKKVKFSTLVELLQWRAKHQPNKLAYTFLVDGENEEVHLTYAQLDQQAREMAARLQQMGITGQRALLLYPPGLDFISAFFGCLYAGVVAVPSYPPRRKRPSPRLQAIVRDALPALVLSDAAIREQVKRHPTNDGLAGLQWLVTEQLASAESSGWQEASISADSLAFLQYTSGSTASPKGVMLTHGNLLHNLAIIQQGFEVTTDSRGVTWLSLYHDMGLIGGILEPLYIGSPTTIMPPVSFLQKPLRWLQAISRYQATISGGPNFAYDLCVEKITPQERATLDLSSWKVAFTGAEPVRAETIERFVGAFEPYGFRREAFYPCYGMAEATLLVAGGLTTAAPTVHHLDKAALLDNQVVLSDDGRPIVGCGHSRLKQKIVIADPQSSALCPDGQVGEIWLKGASVAKGYWNKANATKDTYAKRAESDTFHAFLADTTLPIGHDRGPFLRTGDLGFLLDGELFITGRLKDLMIIRGRNHYPQDIELTAQESHIALQPHCGAAFSVEVEGQERLVIMFELARRHRHANVDEVAAAIRAAVSQVHELEVYAVLLIRPARIPKTTSGKIQRYLCRKAFLEGTLPIIGSSIRQVNLNGHHTIPGGIHLETELRAKLAQLLSVPPAKIDFHQPINRLGLGSLNAMALKEYIETHFGVVLPVELFFEEVTISELITKIRPDISPPAPSATSTQHVYQAPTLNGASPVSPESYQFERFPEYRYLQQRFQRFSGHHPYFKAHEAVNNNKTLIAGRELINYSSYNYVGMSGDKIVSQAAQDAIARYGTSVSASRLVSGEIPLHGQLEKELADFIGTEDCLVYVGGHATNVTTIGHLLGPQDLILHDALIHNSALQGALLSGADRLPFPHNDWQALDQILAQKRHQYRRVLIIIEGVYSMDGDIPNLPQFILVKKRHRALLMVDEAHSIGVLGKHGRGIGEYFDINPSDVDIWMGTLSKSFASCGGYIAGSKALVEYLKYTAPGFVYSVGMSPPNTGAALAAVRLLKAEPQRVVRLHKRARLFLELAHAHKLDTGMSKDSAVIPIIIGKALPCMQLAQELEKCGISVLPMIPPAVQDNASRLRFFISSTHTEEQIRFTIESMGKLLARI